jgi:hypothetical protein
MSVFGTRLLGKVDVVPGLFHVATKCFHINLVPLVPMKSYIVLSQNGKTFRGVVIPLSLKSWGMAWARMFGWLAVIVGIVILIVVLTGHQPARTEDWMPVVLITAAGTALLLIAYKFKPLTHASYDRATKLATLAGFNEEGMAKLRTIYALPPTAAVSTIKPGMPPRVPLPSQRR